MSALDEALVAFRYHTLVRNLHKCDAADAELVALRDTIARLEAELAAARITNDAHCVVINDLSQQELAKFNAWQECDFNDRYNKLNREHVKALIELAAAKKDAERLDWIEKNLADFTYWKENQIWGGIKRHPIEVDWGRDNLVVGGDTLRAAIDAAMKEPT